MVHLEIIGTSIQKEVKKIKESSTCKNINLVSPPPQYKMWLASQYKINCSPFWAIIRPKIVLDAL